MLDHVLPLARSQPADWLDTAIIAGSIIMAVLAIILMFLRLRPVPGVSRAADSANHPRSIDPVLLISALSVIGLAVAAWVLR